MSKVWTGVGAWALDAERAEAEEREQAAAAAASAAVPASSILAGESSQSFPSLREVASTKQSKKKKKSVAIPLSQFATGSYGTGGGTSSGFDSGEMLRLPTGPRERSTEELEHGRHGGGFRFYGGAGGGPPGGFSGRRIVDYGFGGSWDGPGGRRGYRGSDVETSRGPPARASDFDQPSRADEVDSWGAGKKLLAPSPAFSGRVDRYSSLAGRSSSRADEMDSWSSAKKPFASDYPSFGTGRRDSRARPDTDPDRWVRELGGTVIDGGERPKLILDPPKRAEGVQREPVRTWPSPFGNARPREEILAEKGLDWRKIDVDIDNKRASRPTSSQSSRPSSSQSSRPGSPVSASTVPKPKMNPFGNAKPREVLLQEKGVDWRKIDLELEHRSVDRPETDEEKQLKEEINHLKVRSAELERHFNDSPDGSSVELSKLHEERAIRERDLELLIRQFDDKVKFGEKAVGSVRPGSGSSRSDSSSIRASSQSGMLEDLRNVEIIDRPRSHGGRAGNLWAKPSDDKRSFHRSRERSFFDSGSAVRTSSRIGW